MRGSAVAATADRNLLLTLRASGASALGSLLTTLLPAPLGSKLLFRHIAFRVAAVSLCQNGSADGRLLQRRIPRQCDELFLPIFKMKIPEIEPDRAITALQKLLRMPYEGPLAGGRAAHSCAIAA